MCGCKRIRTVRSSMWNHMFSETSVERFVCRSRTSPFCPSEYHSYEDIVLGWQRSPPISISALFCTHHRVTSKTPVKLGCIVFSLCYFTTYTSSHVFSQFWTFTCEVPVPCQTYGPLVLHTLKPWRKSLRKSFVIHLFARSTVRWSLLVLSMFCSPSASAHKSWSSWVWSHNPPPPVEPGMWFHIILLNSTSILSY